MTTQFNRLVRRQAGCFTRRQALQLGISVHDLERHILDGVWLTVMGDVLIVAGAPVTERMKSWTAVLAAGGDVAARMLALECEWTIAPFAVEEISRSVNAVADEIVGHVHRLEARRAA